MASPSVRAMDPVMDEVEQRAVPTGDGHPCRVLVVERDALVADVIGRLLRHAGGQPALATQRSAAMHLLREESFDLCLVDLCLSDGSGRGVVAAAREEQPDILIAVTNGILGREEDLPAEGDLFVYMPFSLEVLGSLVAMARGRQRRRWNEA